MNIIFWNIQGIGKPWSDDCVDGLAALGLAQTLLGSPFCLLLCWLILLGT